MSKYVATIEPVSACPVKCTLCPVSRKDVTQPRAELMSRETAVFVARRLRREFGVEDVSFGNWGEPLLHRDIVAILDIFKAEGFKSLYVSSSLSIDIDAEALALSGADQIDLSTSGMTEAVYHRAHAKGRFELVMANVVALAAAAQKHPGKLHVGMRWHRYRYNEFQLGEARAFCRAHGIEFKPYCAHVGGVEALHNFEHGTLPPAKQKFAEEEVFTDVLDTICDAHAGATSCDQSFNLVIHPDGRLLHCCARMEAHQASVDFFSTTRADIEAFKRGPQPACEECLERGWSGYMYSDKKPETAEALRRAGVVRRPTVRVGVGCGGVGRPLPVLNS